MTRPSKEEISFRKFVGFCYILGGFCFLGLGFLYLFGVPNFSNLDEEFSFCTQNGGFPVQPSRDTYNEMLCTFFHNDTHTDFAMTKITNKEWAESVGYYNKYCFTCWNERDCGSIMNDVLRSKGVHC